MSGFGATRYIVDADRFWARVTIRENDECWPWTGRCFPTGYGQINLKHADGKWRPVQTHRVAYFLAKGPIPEGAEIRHSCDYPPCCNPLDLLAGTSAENSADMVARGRQSKGEHRPLAKLTEADVVAIRTSLLPQKVLAEIFGVHPSAISKIKSRTHWRHVR